MNAFWMHYYGSNDASMETHLNLCLSLNQELPDQRKCDTADLCPEPIKKKLGLCKENLENGMGNNLNLCMS